MHRLKATITAAANTTATATATSGSEVAVVLSGTVSTLVKIGDVNNPLGGLRRSHCFGLGR
jgi:hypothetical protein